MSSRSFLAASLAAIVVAALAMAAPSPSQEAPKDSSKVSRGERQVDRPPTRQDVDRHSVKMKCAKPGPGGFVGDPYPLDHCVVSDEPLGKDAVTVVLDDMRDPLLDGRQMKFCCAVCAEKFQRNPAPYIEKLDAEIIKASAASYPLTHCLVMIEEKLGDDAQTFVYANRVYRTCRKQCVNNFKKNTSRYQTAYEKELITHQKASYPLDTCVVDNEKLGGAPCDLILGTRLVRLSRPECASTFYADPAKYLAMIDAAAKAKKDEKKPKTKEEKKDDRPTQPPEWK